MYGMDKLLNIYTWAVKAAIICAALIVGGCDAPEEDTTVDLHAEYVGAAGCEVAPDPVDVTIETDPPAMPEWPEAECSTFHGIVECRRWVNVDFFEIVVTADLPTKSLTIRTTTAPPCQVDYRIVGVSWR